jgi:hypothetical protein
VFYSFKAVPGSLNIAGGRGFHLFKNKRWNLGGIFFLLFCPNPAQDIVNPLF